MFKLVQNSAANFLGKFSVLFVGLLCTSQYISILGIDSYGVIGLYNSLFIIMNLCDFGLGMAFNREVACNNRSIYAGNLLRTLETIYGAICLAVVLLFFIFKLIGFTHFFERNVLALSGSQSILLYMGVAIILRLPVVLYVNGILGLQYQISYNVITFFIGIMRYALVVPLLYVVPSLHVYFIWQVAIGGLEMLCLRAFLIRKLRPNTEARFRLAWSSLAKIKGFAFGSAVFAVSQVLLSQFDKVILSGIFPLEIFGYYSLATVLAAGIYALIHPIYIAFYPQFVRLIKEKDKKAISKCFHFGSQVVALIVFPVVTVIALFPFEVLVFWTRNVLLAEQAAPILRWLILGMGFHSITHMPLVVQIAYGRLAPPIILSLVGLILLFPVLTLGAKAYGIIVGGYFWLAVQVLYLLIGVPIMFCQLLKGSGGKWCIEDVLRPLIGAIIIPVVMKYLYLGSPSIFQLFILGIVSSISTLLSCSILRAKLYQYGQSCLRTV